MILWVVAGLVALIGLVTSDLTAGAPKCLNAVVATLIVVGGGASVYEAQGASSPLARTKKAEHLSGVGGSQTPFGFIVRGAMTPPGGSNASPSRFGLAGSLLAFATTALYLAMIVSEGNNNIGEFAPWAATFALIGFSAVGASVLPRLRWRARVFAAAAGVSTAVGLVGLWTLGILLLAVAVVLVAAAVGASEGVRNGEGTDGRFAGAVGVVSFILAMAVMIIVL